VSNRVAVTPGISAVADTDGSPAARP
jgi:hypothetical protein